MSWLINFSVAEHLGEQCRFSAWNDRLRSGRDCPKSPAPTVESLPCDFEPNWTKETRATSVFQSAKIAEKNFRERPSTTFETGSQSKNVMMNVFRWPHTNNTRYWRAESGLMPQREFKVRIFQLPTNYEPENI